MTEHLLHNIVSAGENMTHLTSSELVTCQEDGPEYTDKGEEERDDGHVQGGGDQPPRHGQGPRASVMCMGLSVLKKLVQLDLN